MTISELKGLEEIRFTPTQEKIMNLLSDGHHHSKEELHKCLWDEMGSINNVYSHIQNLRKILRPAGYIITIRAAHRKSSYILSQSIAPRD